MSFEGQTAVVTGASSGIGRDLAIALAERGARVLAFGRSAERLAEVRGASDRIVPRVVDLTDDDAVRGAAAEVGDRVDVLVHAAGVITLDAFQEARIEDFDLQYAVNLRAPALLTQLLLSGLTQARGQVVFINSGAGLSARANWGYYAATKHGLKAVADSLREELAPHGVRVSSVYPGRTATSMQEHVRTLERAKYDPERYIQVADVTQMVISVLLLPRSAQTIDLNIRVGPDTTVSVT